MNVLILLEEVEEELIMTVYFQEDFVKWNVQRVMNQIIVMIVKILAIFVV